MLSILGVSRVRGINHQNYIKVLCVDAKFEGARDRTILMNFGYPCFDIYSLYTALGNPNVYCSSYKTSDNELSAYSMLPLINESFSINERVIKSSKVLRSYLVNYNPCVFNDSQKSSPSGVVYYESGWISLNNKLLCKWKPTFSDSNFLSRIVLSNNAVSYSYEESVFLLFENSIRHKPAMLGETLTISLATGECYKHIYTIKNNFYIEYSMQFDLVMQRWFVVRQSVPVKVLGKKTR